MPDARCQMPDSKHQAWISISKYQASNIEIDMKYCHSTTEDQVSINCGLSGIRYRGWRFDIKSELSTIKDEKWSKHEVPIIKDQISKLDYDGLLAK